MEVMARMPVKTLLRFRCVCKTWCSLIDSSPLTLMHIKLYNNNSYWFAIATQRRSRRSNLLNKSSLLNVDDDRIIPYSIVGKSNDYKYKIWGSCNGLILISDKIGLGTLRLWNPFIKKELLLPPFLSNNTKCMFDMFFMGFSPCTNDYKVVAFRMLDDFINANEFTIWIYSLNDRHWRIISKSNKMDVHGWKSWNLIILNDIRNNVYFQGATYWIGCDQYEGMVRETYLFWYDFDVEEFSFVKVPESKNQIAPIRVVFKLGESSLALLDVSLQRFCIWVFEKDLGKDPWRLWFSADINLVVCNEFRMAINSRIFYVCKNNTILIESWGRRGRRLYSFNLTSHEMQDLGDYPYGGYVFDTNVESMVLHKGSNVRRAEFDIRRITRTLVNNNN
ncbi:F-box/kelch-repeat protein At3g23880-like [Spinacia oleracea]|uniref:F-box/kelch-repeat protein At3g23880-like n=1 Tax=Spinacia oleracea TaxID=3562 RepID=A0ABM3QPL9_SPIOL|nr:F-box/kelch-repeat protein At3g23880-like [Spinacia oleracea]